MTAASSKSLTPQISRPWASCQVPKFSRCRSPTDSAGASARAGQIDSIFRAQRKKVARRKTKASVFMRSCLTSRSSLSSTLHCFLSQASKARLSVTKDIVSSLGGWKSPLRVGLGRFFVSLL